MFVAIFGGCYVCNVHRLPSLTNACDTMKSTTLWSYSENFALNNCLPKHIWTSSSTAALIIHDPVTYKVSSASWLHFSKSSRNVFIKPYLVPHIACCRQLTARRRVGRYWPEHSSVMRPSANRYSKTMTIQTFTVFH